MILNTKQDITYTLPPPQKNIPTKFINKKF